MSRPATVFAVLFLAVALAVSACGRKGPLEAPPDSEYPRTYPTR